MKIKRTFTIDKETWLKFEKVSKEKSLNKSLFIENTIKNYIKENVVK